MRCPSVSFTALKRSTSMNNTPNKRPADRSRLGQRLLEHVHEEARLGSAVSVSCKAACRSCSCTR